MTEQLYHFFRNKKRPTWKMRLLFIIKDFLNLKFGLCVFDPQIHKHD